jgi:hypothetical protein
LALTSAKHRATLAWAPAKGLIGSITAAERRIAPFTSSNVLTIGFALDGIHLGLAHGRGGSVGGIRLSGIDEFDWRSVVRLFLVGAPVAARGARWTPSGSSEIGCHNGFRWFLASRPRRG